MSAINVEMKIAIQQMCEENRRMIDQFKSPLYFNTIKIPGLSLPKISFRANIPDFDLKKAIKNFIQVIDYNASYGWAGSSMIEMEFMTNMLKLDDGQKIDKRYNDYFLEDKYENLYSEFQYIVDQQTGGWKDCLRRILVVIKQDINNYSIALPVLYAFLEHQFVRINGKNTDSVNKRLIKKIEESISQEEGKYLEQSILGCNINIANKFVYDHAEFKEDFPKENRNSVMHGRLEPERWSMNNFLKVVCLISSLT